MEKIFSKRTASSKFSTSTAKACLDYMYKKGIVSLEKVDKTYRYQTNPSCLKEISAIWKKQKSIETTKYKLEIAKRELMLEYMRER
jgi:predicted transcriptional regulator